MAKTVKVTYNVDTLETTIFVDGKPFDTSRINGKEIADWAYPFMVRKVRWNGFYDEMVDALGGETEFNLVFEGSEDALSELREAWENAPVNVVSDGGENVVAIAYDENNLTTSISVNDKPFDTSRINGKEIEDWVYPFMIRKVKWNGIFEELASVVGSEEYTIRFSGSNAAMKALMEECPDTVQILKEKNRKKPDSVTIDTKDNEPVVAIEKSESQEENYFAPVRKTVNLSDYQPVQSTHIMYLNDWESRRIFNQNFERASSGNSYILLTLGDCYKFGRGTEQSYEEAVKCYAKAAEKGNAYAQFEVGCCLYHGEGITRNHVAALEFYFSSAELGNGVAREMLGFLAYQGDNMAYELFQRLKPLPSEYDEDNYYEDDYISTSPVRYKSGYSTTESNYAQSSGDAKQAVKFGLKVGTGVLKIASTISGVSALGAAASAIEKIANSVIDGDFSSAIDATVDWFIGDNE